MNLLGENPATELEDINQEIADLQKDILAGVKAHWDVTELAERVQELRSRKTEIEAGRTAEKRNKERINNLRESIEKSKDKVLAYDELLVRNFIKEIKIFPDKLTITVISGAHKTSQFNIDSILPSRTIGTAFLFRPESIEVVLDKRDNPKYNNSRYSITR